VFLPFLVLFDRLNPFMHTYLHRYSQWTIGVAGGDMDFFPLGDAVVLKADIAKVSEYLHVPQPTRRLVLVSCRC
jgi:hypothetical protein